MSESEFQQFQQRYMLHSAVPGHQPFHALVPRSSAWPDGSRAAPNFAVRSSLFSVARQGLVRQYHNQLILASQDGLTVAYTGQQLDQNDLDVYLCVLHAFRFRNLHDSAHLIGVDLLAMMGLTDSGVSRDRIHERLERITATALTIRDGKRTYCGSLISGYSRVGGVYIVRLDPGISEMMANGHRTVFIAARRTLLSSLAKWLHAWLSSHGGFPYPMFLDRYHQLSGSTQNQREFRRYFKRAADELIANGAPFEYEISKSGKVIWRRLPKC